MSAPRPVPDGRSPFKEALMQMTAGGTAGCVEVSLMQPLDVIKTRFQLPNHAYSGMVDCTRQMYQDEGLLSFWKGLLPPVLVQTPKRAYKFFVFDSFRRAFESADTGVFGQNGIHPTVVAGLSGLLTGMTEAALVNPTEVIKVKMQLDRAHQKEAASTWEAAKEIVREDGWWRKGLVGRGMTASMLRDGTWNAAYFGIYHGGKAHFPPIEDNEALDFLRRFSMGLVAGSVASVINIPFDVAKSRIQGPQDEIQYSNSTIKTIMAVGRREGVGALYTGLVPKILRLGPGGAIMMLVYEWVYSFLEMEYPD